MRVRYSRFNADKEFLDSSLMSELKQDFPAIKNGEVHP